MRAFIRFCVFCALVSVSGTITFAQTPTSAVDKSSEGSPLLAVAGSQAKDERYRIGFQDRLEIQVFRHPELTQRVDVDTNGTISLYRLNVQIVAICKTEQELKKDVEDAYRKDYLKNPEVSVVAVEQRSRAFAVMGAVEKPAQYLVPRRIRLIELLALAGGPSKEAGSHVIVARTGSTSNCKMNEVGNDSDHIELLDFKLKDILEAKENLVMRPGDIISVMKGDLVYVYGNVNKQGVVEMKSPITLTQAIVAAEGFKPASDKSKVRILRQKAGGVEREEMIFDLNKINKREVADPFLEPNDVVAVTEDKAKSIMNKLGKTLTNGLPSLLYKVPL